MEIYHYIVFDVILIGMYLSLYTFNEMPIKYRIMLPLLVFWIAILNCIILIRRKTIGITQQGLKLSKQMIKWENIIAIKTDNSKINMNNKLIVFVADNKYLKETKHIDVRYIDLSLIHEAIELKRQILNKIEHAVLIEDKIKKDRFHYWRLTESELELIIDNEKLIKRNQKIYLVLIIIVLLIAILIRF